MASNRFSGLGRALRHQRGEFEAEWLAAFSESRVRLPSTVDPREFSAWVAPIVDGLADAFSPRSNDAVSTSALTAGAPDLREVEKSAAFIGATLATERAGFDIGALLLSLRAPLLRHTPPEVGDEVRDFVEWLSVLALESFGTARCRSVAERAREQLENGTPVVLVGPELPAAFLLGPAERAVLDSVFARLVLLIARVGARVVILDASGCEDPTDERLLECLGTFLSHRKLAGRITVFASGLESEHEKYWSGAAVTAGAQLVFEYAFDRAMAKALQSAGYRLVSS